MSLKQRLHVLIVKQKSHHCGQLIIKFTPSLTFKLKIESEFKKNNSATA